MSINDLPPVQIVILNWNNAPDTINCLRSLQRASYKNAEVVLIDNASSDDSVEKIRASFPQIEVIKNSTNLGVAGGRNVGIQFVLNKIKDDPDKAPAYILFLDNDTIIKQEFLTHMVSAAQSDSSIGVLSCKIYYMDSPNILWAAGGILRFSRGTIALRGMDERDVGQFNEADDIDFAFGCAFMVSRSALQHIGKFDSIFGVYFDEEIDWCIRAKREGYRIVYVPQAHILHGSSRTTPGVNYWKQKARNHLILMRRYATKSEWLKFILSFPLIVFTAVGYQIQHGDIKNLFHLARGMMSNWRIRPRI